MPQIKPLEGSEQFQGYTEKAQFDPINVPDPNQGLGNLLSTVNASFQNMSAGGQQQFEQEAVKWQQLSQFSQTLTEAIGTGYKMYDENAKEQALAEFNIDQGAMSMILSAKDVKKQEVKDDMFVVPADYKKMTQEELKNMMGGGR